MNSKKKETIGNSSRIWSWIIATIGGLFTMWGIFWGFYSIYSYLKLDPLYYDYIFMKDLIIEMGVIFSVPELIIGIPLLILGIKLIRKEKAFQINPIGVGNSLGK